MAVSMQLGPNIYKLYYVWWTDCDGNDCSRAVVAKTVENAINLFKEDRYGLEGWEDNVDPSQIEDPDMVREMPWAKVQGPERVVAWDQSPVVWDNEQID